LDGLLPVHSQWLVLDKAGQLPSVGYLVFTDRPNLVGTTRFGMYFVNYLPVAVRF
jgi:hypothetical protein